jgi:hypothetical protein
MTIRPLSTWLTVLVAACLLMACTRVPAVSLIDGPMPASSQGRSTIRVDIQPAAFQVKANWSDIDKYVVNLRHDGDNTLEASQSFKASDLAQPALGGATFTQVKDGTYYVEVNAHDAGGNSLNAGGTAVRSTNTATVASPNVSYGDDADGNRVNSLVIRLQLAGSGSATGAVQVDTTGGTPSYASLVSNGLALAGYVSNAASFRFTGVADGTYAAWGFASLGGGWATLSQPSTGEITVSNGGATVSGNLAINSVAPQAGIVGPRSTQDGWGGTSEATGATRVLQGLNNDLILVDTQRRQLRILPGTSTTAYNQALTAGQVQRIAGGGTDPTHAAVALNAPLGDMTDAAIDGQGNVFLVDFFRHHVQMLPRLDGTYFGQVMSAGKIYVIAGTGTAGSTGDGGPATAATLSQPRKIATDADGNVYVCTSGSAKIRLIARAAGTYFGQTLAVGEIRTVVGGGTTTISTNGIAAASATLTNGETGIAVDGARHLYVASDSFGLVMIPSSTTTLWDGVSKAPLQCWRILTTGVRALAVSPAGHLMLVPSNDTVQIWARADETAFNLAMTANSRYTVAGNGTNSPEAAHGDVATSPGIQARDVAADAQGNLIVIDGTYHRVLAVAAQTATAYGIAMTAGRAYRLAGNGQTAVGWEGFDDSGQTLGDIRGIAYTPQGDIAVCHYDSLAKRNYVTVRAAAGGTAYGVNMSLGKWHHVIGQGTAEGDGEIAVDSRVRGGHKVVSDSAGHLFLVDEHRVRMIPRTDVTAFGQTMAAGRVYTVAGTLGVSGNAGDGGSGLGATLNPYSLTVDRFGNVLIGSINRVRIVARTAGTYYGLTVGTGQIAAFAGADGQPQATDESGRFACTMDTPVSIDVHDDHALVCSKLDQRLYLITTTAKRLYGAQRQANRIYWIAGDTGIDVGVGLGGPGRSAGIMSTQYGTAMNAAGHWFA